MTPTPSELVEQWRSEAVDSEDAPMDSRLIAIRHANELAAALAASGEAVAWTQQSSLDELKAEKCSGISCGTYSERYGRTAPLYAAPQPASVPAGFVLVPVEPTPEMLRAGFLARLDGFDIATPSSAPGPVYAAMIAAASGDA